MMTSFMCRGCHSLVRSGAAHLHASVIHRSYKCVVCGWSAITTENVTAQWGSLVADPDKIGDMFAAGLDTKEIACRIGAPEAEVYNALETIRTMRRIKEGIIAYDQI